VKKMLSQNPTLAVLSFWWEKSGGPAVWKKTALAGDLALIAAGLGVGVAVMTTGLEMLLRVGSGKMGHPWCAPVDWLSGIAMAHPAGYFFLAIFSGGLGCFSLFLFLDRMIEGSMAWALVPMSLLGLFFFPIGLAVWIILGLGFGLRAVCRRVVALPSRLRARRDHYLEKNPELLARLEKARLESGVEPSMTPSRRSRL
jgi:hypothetical protein